MDRDDLFGFTPDADFDGDNDLQDYLIHEDELDQIEEDENKRGKPVSSDDWQENVEDGSEFGIDPYDYETEEEYNEALTKAKENSSESIPTEDTEVYENHDSDLSSPVGYAKWMLGLLKNDPAYFENPEDVKAEIEKCEFIINHHDDILAAKYYSLQDKFNYGKAIADNFKLPTDFVKSGDIEHINVVQIIKDISLYDIDLSIKVWEWLVKEFLPYAKYEDDLEYFLRGSVLLEVSENYFEKLVDAFEENPEFCKAIIGNSNECYDEFGDIIAFALKKGKNALAQNMLKTFMETKNKMNEKIYIISRCIEDCQEFNDDSITAAFRNYLLPILRSIRNSRLQSNVELWENEI